MTTVILEFRMREKMSNDWDGVVLRSGIGNSKFCVHWMKEHKEEMAYEEGVYNDNIDKAISTFQTRVSRLLRHFSAVKIREEVT